MKGTGCYPEVSHRDIIFRYIQTINTHKYMYGYISMILKFTAYIICTSINIQKQFYILSKLPNYYNEYCNTVELEMNLLL